ncbi:MAG: hypothetical protein QOF80_91 [Verrucomicrobiota bacterium]
MNAFWARPDKNVTVVTGFAVVAADVLPPGTLTRVASWPGSFRRRLSSSEAKFFTKKEGPEGLH